MLMNYQLKLDKVNKVNYITNKGNKCQKKDQLNFKGLY